MLLGLKAVRWALVEHSAVLRFRKVKTAKLAVFKLVVYFHNRSADDFKRTKEN